MTDGTCVTPGCERPVWVKRTGECSSCQSRRYRRENPGRGRSRHKRECAACGADFISQSSSARFCSDLCFIYTRNGPQTCRWPKPTRKAAAPKPPPFREDRECEWCGAGFTATINSQRFCSADHKLRAKRNRRRGRQYGWASHFTWAEVMRVFIRLGRRCAYCEAPVVGLPEPDHVVPLSRGGSNSITNILPACKACNCDKRDLLLDEWRADRVRRGLPPVTTAWNESDPRVAHLTSLASAA